MLVLPYLHITLSFWNLYAFQLPFEPPATWVCTGCHRVPRCRNASCMRLESSLAWLAGGKSTYQRLVKERVSKSIEDWSPSILKHGPTSSWYSCIAYKWKVKMQSRINQSSKILVRTLFIPRLEMNRSATNRFSTSYRGIWRSGRFAGLSSICHFSWFLVSLSSCLFLAPASLSFPFFSCFFLFYSLCLLFPFFIPFSCSVPYFLAAYSCSLRLCCLLGHFAIRWISFHLTSKMFKGWLENYII